MNFDANVSDTNFTQSNDILESILSVPQYKARNVTFSYGVAFTKGTTGDEFFYNIPELDTRNFENCKVFYTSPAAGTSGLNYVYAAIHQLLYSSSSIVEIVPAVYTIASLVCYCINGIYGHNLPEDMKKLKRFLIFKHGNILMKTLEATTQLGGFNQLLPTRKSSKRFSYSGPH